ncbi:MAG: hypothetical protein FWH54_04540 [Methanobrevibacter sp.]|nr:hypothetical protein [Methanobrevibacter sp.]
MIRSLVISLILTIIIELGVAIALGIRNKNDLLLVILVNTLTNPIVVYLANISMGFSPQFFHILVIAILEISAFLVEGFLLKKYLNTITVGPYQLSFLMNSVSFICGIIISMI